MRAGGGISVGGSQRHNGCARNIMGPRVEADAKEIKYASLETRG